MPLGIREQMNPKQRVSVIWSEPTTWADSVLRELQVLVTRKTPYEKNTDRPLGDTIRLEDAIRVVTMGGAYSMREENEIGSLERGKAADMIVLDRNLFQIDPDSIIDTKVVYTIFAGKIVHDAHARTQASLQPARDISAPDKGDSVTRRSTPR